MTKKEIDKLMELKDSDWDDFVSKSVKVEENYEKFLALEIIEEVEKYGFLRNRMRHIKINEDYCREEGCKTWVRWGGRVMLNDKDIFLEPKCGNHFLKYWEDLKKENRICVNE